MRGRPLLNECTVAITRGGLNLVRLKVERWNLTEFNRRSTLMRLMIEPKRIDGLNLISRPHAPVKNWTSLNTSELPYVTEPVAP